MVYPRRSASRVTSKQASRAQSLRFRSAGTGGSFSLGRREKSSGPDRARLETERSRHGRWRDSESSSDSIASSPSVACNASRRARALLVTRASKCFKRLDPAPERLHLLEKPLRRLCPVPKAGSPWRLELRQPFAVGVRRHRYSAATRVVAVCGEESGAFGVGPCLIQEGHERHAARRTARAL